MKKYAWQIWLGLILVAVSSLLYFTHYLIFHDLHHIFIYMVGDIAFLPIDVLIVTLILHQLLTRREKQAMLQKMNMVIGAFFSEVGMDIIEMLSAFDMGIDERRHQLLIKPNWSEHDFSTLVKVLRSAQYRIDVQEGDIKELKDFLASKRDFMLRLLENPILLEHEQFTDLLWAVFHLTEELNARKSVSQFTQTDCDHLAGDLKRAYSNVVIQWVLYMKHLKVDYPYLFSLAVRMNPFDLNASAEIY